jgi:hypothetical protein
VFALPSLALSCVQQVLTIGIQAAAEGASAESAGALAGATGLGVLCISGLSFVYSILLAYISPAMYVQFARTGSSIGATLKIGELLNIARVNSGEYLKVFLSQLGFGIAAGIFVLVTCGLGLLAVIPLAPIVTGHLAGQYKRVANL